MRFPTSAKSIALVLALAFGASSIGCAAPTGDDGANIGSEQQAASAAPDMGTIAGGAQAAITLLGMFTSYQKYGDAQITPGEILTKVEAVQADVTALRASVDELHGSIETTNKDTVAMPTITLVNNMDALWKGYKNAAASNVPDALPNYLAEVRRNQATQGSVRWADFRSLNQVLVGQGGSSSLIKLLAQTKVKEGTASAEDDTLGRFVADRLLVQEQAFFVMSLVDAQNPSVDLAQEKIDQAARMAAQRLTFLEANELYNQKILEQVAAPRVAQVSQCEYGGISILGIPVAPNDGTYFFNDAAVTDAHNAYWGRQGCADNRVTYLAKISTEVQAPWVAKMSAAQTVYNLLNLTGTYSYTPADGTKNDWNNVTVSLLDARTVTWTNDAGIRWNLTLTSDLSKVAVSSDSPYFAGGYTTADVQRDAKGRVTGIVGPEGGVYATIGR